MSGTYEDHLGEIQRRKVPNIILEGINKLINGSWE